MSEDSSAALTESKRGPLDVKRVMAALPHRYPMLLVDRVESLIPDEKISAIKAVTINESFFQGHFPGRPIMPGVLIVEALAQAAGIAVYTLDEYRGKLGLFAGIDDCRFKRMVVPGDTLRLEVTVEKLRGMFGRVRAVATVDGEVAVEATLSIIIPRDQGLGGGAADA